MENRRIETESGWIPIGERGPEEVGIEPDAAVLCWHQYSGVMVDLCGRIFCNRFYSYWMEIDDAAWIKASDQMPTEKDADIYSCVLARYEDGRTLMTGWRRFHEDPLLAEWQRAPDGPGAA